MVKKEHPHTCGRGGGSFLRCMECDHEEQHAKIAQALVKLGEEMKALRLEISTLREQSITHSHRAKARRQGAIADHLLSPKLDERTESAYNELLPMGGIRPLSPYLSDADRHSLRYPLGGAAIFDPEALDAAIVGVFLKQLEYVAVYDYDMLVDIFAREFALTDDDSESAAQDWVDYNLVRGLPYMGPRAPIIAMEMGPEVCATAAPFWFRSRPYGRVS